VTLWVLGKPSERHLRLLAERLGGDTRVVVFRDPGALAEAAAAPDAILSWFAKRELLEAALARAPRVRWVHSASVGVDTLVSPALAAHPSVLTNARGVYSAALAEFAVAGMLFFAKDLRRLARSQSEGRWDPFEVEMLKGKVLGIAGYGDIGRTTAALARAFGMRILALRRRMETDALVERFYTAGERRDMFAASDYVLAALPLTPETRGLVGAAELAVMQPSAVLINVGRGPVVDEAALVRALQEKRIRGAVLDVFDREPLPEGHAFYRLENVLLSPHSADHTAGWMEQSLELFLENFERFRKGEPLKNAVEKSLGY
jgi:phosphoglycerate dehydrogenase-like enzyme